MTSSPLGGINYLVGLVLTLAGLLVCGAIVGAGTVYAFDALFHPGSVLPTAESWLWWGVLVLPSLLVCAVGIRAFQRAHHQGESYGTLTTYLAYVAPVLLALGLGGGGAFGYETLVERKERRRNQHQRDCEAAAEIGDLSQISSERCIEAARSCRDDLRDSPCNQTFNSSDDARDCRNFRRDQIESIREYGLDLPSPRELSTDSSVIEDPDDQSRRLCVLRRLLESGAHSAK